MIDNRTSPYTIGFFTAGTSSEYSTLITQLISQIAQEENINLINYLGGCLDSQASFSQYKYQYQCNVAFDFARTPHLDGIILESSILSSHLDATHFYNRFSPTPMVSLGAHISELPSVYTDNISIFRELVTHIISVHNRQHIGFISGPSSDKCTFERYLGYSSALAENHIPYNADYVFIGDLTPSSAKEAVHALLDERHLTLDAIVCANDSMALAVMSELQNRELHVPDDIIVTGCDDLPNSTYSVPSLTSIEKPLEDMVRAAVKLLIETIEGEPKHNIIIPSKIAYRTSCGCHFMPYSSIISAFALAQTEGQAAHLADNFLKKCSSILSSEIILGIRDFVVQCYQLVTTEAQSFAAPQSLIEAFFNPLCPKLTSIHAVLNLNNCLSSLKADLIHLATHAVTLRYIDHIFSQVVNILLTYLLDFYGRQTNRLNQNFSFTSQFLLTVTHHMNSREQQLQSIIPSLMEFGITSCLIYLYSSSIKHGLSDTWKTPHEISLYTGYINQKMISKNLLPCPIDIAEISSYGFKERKDRYTSCVHPIFFDDEQLGVLVCEMSVENYSLINHLTVELGCALKLSSTFNAQREIENKLETLSQTDELTHLFNRRGFFQLAQTEYTTSRIQHQSGVLFYADMDNLKVINDTFGHNEGDFAIQTMGHILKEAFTPNDIIGRIGGDEFIILSTQKKSNFIEQAIRMVNELCDKFNASHKRPYRLSITLGGIFYSEDDTDTLDYLISRADTILYNEKRLKKSRNPNTDKDHCDLI